MYNSFYYFLLFQ